MSTSVSIQDVTQWPWPSMNPLELELVYEITYRDKAKKLKTIKSTLTCPTMYFGMKYYDVDEDWSICFEQGQKITDLITSSALLNVIGIKNPNHTYCVAKALDHRGKLGPVKQAMLSVNPAGPKMKDWALISCSDYRNALKGPDSTLVGFYQDIKLVEANQLALDFTNVYFAYHYQATPQPELYINCLGVTDASNGLKRYQTGAKKVRENLTDLATRVNGHKDLAQALSKIVKYSNSNLFLAPLPLVSPIKVPSVPEERNEALYQESNYPIPNKIRSKALVFAGVNLFYMQGQALINSQKQGDYLLRFVGPKRLQGFLSHPELKQALFDAITMNSDKKAFAFLLNNFGGKSVDSEAIQGELDKVSRALTPEEYYAIGRKFGYLESTGKETDPKLTKSASSKRRPS